MPYLLLCLLLAAAPLSAQTEPPADFSVLLDSLGLTLNLPADHDFRVRPNAENDYLASQYTLVSRRAKTELRFHLVPESETDFYYRRPHLRTGLLQVNLGSNAENAVTAVHSFGEEELAVLNADWARMYTFRPKTAYAGRRQAQLVALYREGRGLAYVVILFDKAPGSVEDLQLALNFR